MTYAIIGLIFLVCMIIAFAIMIYKADQYFKKHPQDEYRIKTKE